jgi:hypothetical protein
MTYPDGMPEWAKLTEAELRGEDSRPSVQAKMAKWRLPLRKPLNINAAPPSHPNCCCVRKEQKK